MAQRAATCSALGITSFDDWLAFTWSFGCTSRPSAARARRASSAITSFAFMFVEVPEPVWKTSTGNWSSSSPHATRSAALAIARARAPSSFPAPSLARAAAAFSSPSAARKRRGNPIPLIGKFSIARCVEAPQSASAGTSTVPMESRSLRVFVLRDGIPKGYRLFLFTSLAK